MVVVVLGWVLAGLGIGLAHATTSVLAFALAPVGEEGLVASSLQVMDNLFAAVSTGAGGALFAVALARLGSERDGILLAFLVSITLVLLSVIAAWRIGPLDGAGDRATL